MLGDVGRMGTWLLAAIFIAVGLNLLGILPLPSFGASPDATRRRGASGALLLGLVFGAAHGPCTFAFMAPLLGLVLRAGESGGTFGFVLVALFALGHSAAIAFAGASFQLVQRWVSSNGGASAIRFLRAGAGAAVLAGGLYFVYTAL
jgi:cytochrome c-type biogenesis protein